MKTSFANGKVQKKVSPMTITSAFAVVSLMIFPVIFGLRAQAVSGTADWESSLLAAHMPRIEPAIGTASCAPVFLNSPSAMMTTVSPSLPAIEFKKCTPDHDARRMTP